jgi:curli biogenesis system outer membrane secretion channel CsgG
MDNLHLDLNPAQSNNHQLKNHHRSPKIGLALIFTSLLISAGIANSYAEIDGLRPTLVAQNSAKKKRPRIAVLDFDYSTITDEWRGFFRSNAQGVSDILINKLVDGGSFAVIERGKIQQVVQEQNFGATDRIDSTSAAKIGKILGVQSIVIGSITNFNVERDNNGVSIPFFGSVGGGKTTANVKINVRVVDTATGEILFTAEGNGSSNHGDNSINVRGFSFGNSGSNKESKLLSTATADALEQIATKINSKAAIVSEASIK